MFDVTLECIRAAILAYLLVHLLIATHKQTDIPRKGWNFILTGFSLLLFANLMDITDNIDSLSRFVVVGNTTTQAILEKIIGYSGGFLFLSIGLLKWLPSVTTRNKLHSSERNFRLAFETSGFGMAIGSVGGRLIKVNKSFCEITGYSEDELLNKDFASLTHPDDIEKSNTLIKNLISGSRVHQAIEKRYIHKDGSTIWAIISVSIITDENGEPSQFVSQINNITERKNAERTIQKNEDHLNAIFASAPIGMLLINQNTVVKQVNDVAAKLAGRSTEQIINTQPGNGLGCAHSTDDPKGCGHGEVCIVCPLRNTVMKVLETNVHSIGNEIQVELSINNKIVRPWLKVSVSPVEIDGNRNVILTAENITDRKETENQLIIQKDRADKMAAEALSANKAKSRFLASMSHEIRTPMNSIIGFSGILAEEVSSDDHKEYVNVIRNSGNHLLQLINDILDYSKIEAGKLDVDISLCPLQETLDKVEAMMRPFAESKNLNFEFTKSPDVPEKISTDPGRIEQCIINLVNNAIKFTDQGHVKVNTSVETIDSEEFVCIDVEDTGIGISPESQKDVFDSFTQAEQESAKKIAGTGLGLAITKQLTELLGGTIRLASKISEGSTFSILIPVKCKKNVDLQANNLQHQDETQTTEKMHFSGKCLVSDEDATNRHLMGLLLEKMGFSVTLANSHEDAIEKTKNNEFDMIFIDIPLLAETTANTTEKIRANAPNTPMIALTTNPIVKDENTICNECLQKPITQKQLNKTAIRYISENQTAKG